MPDRTTPAKTIRVLGDTWDRMAQLGIPLTDRPNDVVAKLLDYFDATTGSNNPAERMMLLHQATEARDEGIANGTWVMPEEHHPVE